MAEIVRPGHRGIRCENSACSAYCEYQREKRFGRYLCRECVSLCELAVRVEVSSLMGSIESFPASIAEFQKTLHLRELDDGSVSKKMIGLIAMAKCVKCDACGGKGGTYRRGSETGNGTYRVTTCPACNGTGKPSGDKVRPLEALLGLIKPVKPTPRPWWCRWFGE